MFPLTREGPSVLCYFYSIPVIFLKPLGACQKWRFQNLTLSEVGLGLVWDYPAPPWDKGVRIAMSLSPFPLPPLKRETPVRQQLPLVCQDDVGLHLTNTGLMGSSPVMPWKAAVWPWDSAERSLAHLEDLSLPVSFPPSRFLIFVFRVAIKTMVNYSTHTLECRNPHSTWSVHRPFWRHGAPHYCSQLWESLVRGTPESQLLSFQITSRLLLSKSPSSFPNHRHWLLPKFHTPWEDEASNPQTHSREFATGSCRLGGVGALWNMGCTFYIIKQNKTFSLQKTKEKKIYIYRPE